MAKFSERQGFKAISQLIQSEGMNDPLRNSLWNCLDMFIWSASGFVYSPRGGMGSIDQFSKRMWFEYFKKPIDARPVYGSQILKSIRDYFFNCPWFEVYDFIEYVIGKEKKDDLIKVVNHTLERELAGYRIIDSKFVSITDKDEVKMLEEALQDTKFKGVSEHLKRATELLSDRQQPDYRNSIKESISAVESMAHIITENAKATLGDMLKELERSRKLHPALRNGFSNLYGYTNDADGIRHAMLNESDLTAADAKYFLLSCTSFINYLKSFID